MLPNWAVRGLLRVWISWAGKNEKSGEADSSFLRTRKMRRLVLKDQEMEIPRRLNLLLKGQSPRSQSPRGMTRYFRNVLRPDLCYRVCYHDPTRWCSPTPVPSRSEENTSELQSPCNLVCRLLLENKQLLYRH